MYHNAEAVRPARRPPTAYHRFDQLESRVRFSLEGSGRYPVAMRIVVLVSLVLVLAACGGQSGRSSPAPPALPVRSTAASAQAGGAQRLPAFSHIFLIVMENKDYGDIIGSAAAPYLNSLAAQYGLATDYFAVAHPSLPNYLALIGGSTYGVESDCTSCFQNAPNLADQLQSQGKSWKAYMEDLPRPCFLGSDSGRYALKHNPWLYFDDVRNSPARCQQVVPLTQLDADLAANTLPNLAWITPNLCHDMHDCSVGDGDSWLASFLPKLLGAQAWRDGGLILITWDEGSSDAGCCNAAHGGHVPLLVIAPGMRQGFRSNSPLDHYSVLRTIEDAWSLGHLGAAGSPATASLAPFFSPAATP